MSHDMNFFFSLGKGMVWLLYPNKNLFPKSVQDIVIDGVFRKTGGQDMVLLCAFSIFCILIFGISLILNVVLVITKIVAGLQVCNFIQGNLLSDILMLARITPHTKTPIVKNFKKLTCNKPNF